VDELRRQARLAEDAGFDGLMTSEHHGGFPGYVPNPLQLAGWLLEATENIWAAPCPLLLPLYHWSHVAEQLAWMAARFPGRVGAGFALGGLDRDFEMADLDYAERFARFREGLPRICQALRGEAEGPLADDPAIAACRESPVPVVSAAQSPAAVRRAARVGIGVLYDSLQTLDRTREISDVYAEAGGRATRIAIRRVWVGPPPEAEVEAQMNFYRGYASQAAQAHWGDGQQLVSGADGAEVAEKLLEIADRGGCDAFNLRLHVKGITPSQIEAQIARLGAETLPVLSRGLAERSKAS
jgi:alkanesulfonate monooxygenase SsuD/methylene tetrahydromethanopterin reductase-like flavin-dependent oxidoreductase (luciferase family)